MKSVIYLIDRITEQSAHESGARKPIREGQLESNSDFFLPPFEFAATGSLVNWESACLPRSRCSFPKREGEREEERHWDRAETDREREAIDYFLAKNNIKNNNNNHKLAYCTRGHIFTHSTVIGKQVSQKKRTFDLPSLKKSMVYLGVEGLQYKLLESVVQEKKKTL